ncbi:unnamed protein product [Periconia digitata]|uniref:Uncharacterized protein n=1 Tax=Periconia digitata TaxID=1303443 RepID=A0A9W4XGP0_9PLEO|nr:unnamed protein product [Periconia digitata]
MSGFTNNATSNPSAMRWSCVDLLSHSSVLLACQPSTYSLVIEKSTSDSISCADDVQVALPYCINVPQDAVPVPGVKQTQRSVHPLHLVAIHLALVTKPGGRWISLSYSDNRYPFLDESGLENSISDPMPTQNSKDMTSRRIVDDRTLAAAGNELPNPSRLWKLV